MLEQLQERRRYECRLDPERALRSLDEAAAFLDDRGILTRSADCALPSLFEACHQPPYRAGGRGFAGWPESAWPWFAQLSERDGVVQLSAHHGTRVLMTRAVARLADPLCRAGLQTAEEGGGDPAALLGHLAAAGPSHLDDLKVELGWDAGRLRGARAPLERAGAVVSRGVTDPAGAGGHLHTSLLQRWDQVFPEPTADGSAETLIAACVRAAVLVPGGGVLMTSAAACLRARWLGPTRRAVLNVAYGHASAPPAARSLPAHPHPAPRDDIIQKPPPESEPLRWFSFVPRIDAGAVGRLVDEGALCRPAPGWLALSA